MVADMQNRASRRPQGRFIGYARVSVDEQATEAQEKELRSGVTTSMASRVTGHTPRTGCTRIEACRKSSSISTLAKPAIASTIVTRTSSP